MYQRLKLLFSISVIILISYVFLLSYKYAGLPERILIKNLKNQIDYGDKILLFLPIIINVIILLLVWRAIKHLRKMIKLDNTAGEKDYIKIQFTIVVASVIFTLISTYILFFETVF